jgi:hypothetical protein
MATAVKTPDVRIVIDSGAALGPRFGLAPHPLEYRALAESRERIRKACSESEVSIITHYHHDHYSPPFDADYVWTWSDARVAAELYEDKVMLIKDPRENINPSQRMRAYHFSRFLGDVSRETKIADGNNFEFGDTKVSFSEPVPHGEEGTRLGYVIMARINWEDQTFLFASDVQGPMADRTRVAILRTDAKTLYLGGPPAYLAPSQVDSRLIDKGLENLREIAGSTKLTVVDHHLMRTARWKEAISGAQEAASRSGNVLTTAAAYSGEVETTLEATRDQLYRDLPPSREFVAWTRKKYDTRRVEPPPI